MAVAFQQGQKLTKDDLSILITRSTPTGDQPADPFSIIYNLYDRTMGSDLIMLPQNRTPARATLGLYYAPITIIPQFRLGEYKIRWTWQLDAGGMTFQSEYRWNLVGRFTVLDNNALQALIMRGASGFAPTG